MSYDYEKERREAIAAGERALNSLRSARKHLDSAGNWGLVDMFGGGLISTFVKQSKMGNAQSDIDQAKFDLRSFSRELADIDKNISINIETGDFLSFADYFFDGFFVDWMAQDRIDTAKNQVDEAIRKVQIVLDEISKPCQW